ncbi:MAG: DegV family protein, partial [Oscillospiraceae bacterium]|nr:DegV family protein [Oscillospiraceae bacterium]
MNTFILTDSTSDMDKVVIDQLGVQRVSLKVNFGEESFLHGVDISKKEFFE